MWLSESEIWTVEDFEFVWITLNAEQSVYFRDLDPNFLVLKWPTQTNLKNQIWKSNKRQIIIWDYNLQLLPNLR